MVSATEIDGIVGADTTKVVFTVVKTGANFVFTLTDNIDNVPSGAGDADTESSSLESDDAICAVLVAIIDE